MLLLWQLRRVPATQSRGMDLHRDCRFQGYHLSSHEQNQNPSQKGEWGVRSDCLFLPGLPSPATEKGRSDMGLSRAGQRRGSPAHTSSSISLG